jgi:MerR family transcriptional regulator, thiopeptide resistance regulator
MLFLVDLLTRPLGDTEPWSWRNLKRIYRIREFAQLAGVTIKALRHYDRLGLLRARRTEAGYRAYEHRDLERLEQIVALKFIGLPLGDIKQLLDCDVLGIADALRLQHRVLEQK